ELHGPPAVVGRVLLHRDRRLRRLYERDTADNDVAARVGRVASQHPETTRTKPAIVAPVIVSSRNTAPSTTATAGFANVINVARAGPTSPMSAKNTMNAIAVQITASASSDQMVDAGGIELGRATHAMGANTIATALTATAVTPSDGRSER